MTAQDQERFDSISGTYVFDGRLARKGRALNKMCASLIHEDNRTAFAQDQDAYMDRYGLSEEQKAAVKDFDWIRMLELGGNVYFIAKLGVIAGQSVQDINAKMTGVTTEEFKAMLANGGRNPNG